MEKKVEVGAAYRHYKGNAYRVLAVAVHEATGQRLVIYQDETAKEKIWARDEELFLGDVETEEGRLARFMRL